MPCAERRGGSMACWRRRRTTRSGRTTSTARRSRCAACAARRRSATRTSSTSQWRKHARAAACTQRGTSRQPAQASRWRRASTWLASLGLRLTGVGGVQLHRGQQVHAGGAAADEDAGRELHHAQGSGGGAGAPRRTLRFTSLPLLPACWPPHCSALLLSNWLNTWGLMESATAPKPLPPTLQCPVAVPVAEQNGK